MKRRAHARAPRRAHLRGVRPRRRSSGSRSPPGISSASSSSETRDHRRRRRRHLLRLRHAGTSPATSRSSSRRLLARDALLGLQGRPPPDRRSVARRDGDAARRGPAVRRAAHLHALPAAGVPRGRPRARARDPRDRGAARRARPALPGLPRRGRRVVPRLPRLHDPAQAGVRRVRGARSSRSGRCARTARRPCRPASSPARTSCSRFGARALAPRVRLVFPPDGGRDHTRPRQAGRRPPRTLRRDRRALRAARLRAARRAPAQDLEGARARALRRAQGQAVLRRARRLHHLRPRARARRPRRGRDRRRPRR